MTPRLALLGLLLIPACSVASVGESWLRGKARAAGLEEQTYTFGELRVRAWVGGEGPPLVLLHGFGGDGVGTWMAQLEALAPGRRLIVPDLLWFGGSSGGTPGLEAQAVMVEKLVDANGGGPTDIVGISYGGFVTLAVATRTPELLDQIVIVDSPGPFFTEADEAAMLQRLGASSAEEIFLPDSPEDVQRLFDLVYVRDRALPRFVLQSLLTTTFSQHVEEHRALLRELHSRRDQALSLDRPGHPAPLVVWGEQDEVFPVSIGRQLADAMGAELVVLPETAHGPNIEAAAAFNAAVKGYLRP